MKRFLPATLALAAVVACGVWPTTPTGGLIVRNPLAGGFRTQVIPDETERLAVLLVALSDETAKPVRLFSLTRSETTRVVRHLPAGQLRAVVAAFDSSDIALAAKEAHVEIKAGETTKLEVELSTDPELIKRLDRAIDVLAKARPARPQPSETAALPSAAPPASILPVTLPSLQPSTPPLIRPSALPSGGLFPLPFPLPSALLGLTTIDEAFGGTVLNPLRWASHSEGTPAPVVMVNGGLNLGMAPGTRPGASGIAKAEVETLGGSALDLEAGAVLTAESWPRDGAGTRVGLFTQEAALVRTHLAGKDVYVLSAGGNQSIIPAPPPGSRDELRLVKKGTTIEGFAGPVGAVKPVGRGNVRGGSTSLTVGVRSDGLPQLAQPVKVIVHQVGLKPASP